jgi:peptide/nickel transport system substrate-binding protein
MKRFRPLLATVAALGATLAFGAVSTVAAAEKPVRGGMLQFVVGSKIPSYDGHRETTFGMIHPIRPFYSLLLRLNPDNAQSTTDFVCDLCSSYKASADQLTYTFNIRKNVKFHDGTPLTAADIKASLDKIIFPPKGVPSARQAWYTQVASIETPDKYTLTIKMKRALPAIIAALASPFNFIYSKKDLDTHGYTWNMKNINGTGAFQFVQHQPGAFVEGKRYAAYHLAGKPYLDGFKAISAPKMSVRLQAIRGNRAAAEFRGFPPKARDDLVRAMGNKVKVYESDWNVVMGTSANHKHKRFQDVRVRQALSYAQDRWSGSKYLQKIALIRSVGGIVFPKHGLAAKKKWMQDNLPGYSPNAKANRDMAKKLLKEAGYPNLKVTLWNRAVDQPYKVVGTWLVDQWRKAGMKADQVVLPSGPWYAGFRKTKNHDVVVSFNAQTVINPTIDISKWMCSAGNNYSNCTDKKTEDLYFSMLYETDAKKQYEKARAFEKYVLADTAIYAPAFWWYKINVQRTYMKGWNIAPSHYLNQHLDQVWIDPKLR